MNHYTAVLAFWVCSVLGASVAEPPRGYIEPTYMGQPLSHWVEVLGGSEGPVNLISSVESGEIKDIRGGREAQDALEHIGTNAIPFLLRWIEGDPLITVSREGRTELLSPATMERVDSDWVEVFRAPGAVRAFGLLGPAARSAIPELARLVTNQSCLWTNLYATGRRVEPRRSSWSAFNALAAIGPESAPVILTIATNSAWTSGMRRDALVAAAKAMGTNAQALLPIVLQCAKEEDGWVAQGAVGVLRAFGHDDPGVFAALTNALHHPAPAVRMAAIEALQPFGARAVPVLVPALLYEFNATNYGVRYRALDTLVRVAPQTLTNVSVLAKAAEGLRSSDFDARLWAVQTIQAASEQARGQKPNLDLPGRDLTPLCLEATNTLRQLAPDLLNTVRKGKGVSH
jgi:hypothetical protein